MTAIATFDVGSTNFSYAAGTPEGSFLVEPRTERTDADRLLDQLAGAVGRLEDGLDGGAVDAVSVATTGLVDRSAGTIEHFDTADGDARSGLEVRARLDAEYGVPVRVENDCNAAALGEYRYGRGRAYDCVVYVTIGSGIGAGVVERGRLFRGEHGRAAEVGLLPIPAACGLDSFGVPDAWEAYCSGRGIPEFVRHRLAEEDRGTVLEAPIEAADLFAAAEDGDPVAEDYVATLGSYNAAGVGAVVNCFNPGLVSFGGGVVAGNPEAILEPIREGLDRYAFVDPPAVAPTDLGEAVELYGGLALHSEPE